MTKPLPQQTSRLPPPSYPTKPPFAPVPAPENRLSPPATGTNRAPVTSYPIPPPPRPRPPSKFGVGEIATSVLLLTCLLVGVGALVAVKVVRGFCTGQTVGSAPGLD